MREYLFNLRFHSFRNRCDSVWVRSGTVQKDDCKLIWVIIMSAGNLLAFV